MKNFNSILVATAFLAGSALGAAPCQLEIHGTDTMKYTDTSGNKLEKIEIPAECKAKGFEITLKHVGKLPKQAMGHNIIFAETAKVKDIADASKDPAKDFAPPPNTPGILGGSTKVLGGGEQEVFKLDMMKFTAGKDYTFFCTFPGHFNNMKGQLIIK